MYAPRFLVSMITVLIVFAVAVYLMTGSLLATIAQTFLCAIILQVGYFIGVLYLVHREKQNEEHPGTRERSSIRPAKDLVGGSEELGAKAAAQLRTHDR